MKPSDAELLERLFGEGPRGAPGADPELVALERLCAQARRAARAPSLDAERGRVLVERILAATTREDLGRRGDLRLAAGFLRARLRESLGLRLAAASLAAHVLILSAAAWALAR